MTDGETRRLRNYRTATWSLTALLVTSVVLIAILLKRAPQVRNDEKSSRDALLYQAFQQEHPRPSGLPGTPEVDAYDSRYAQWRLQVLEAYERNSKKN